jgi:hypothetical protein
MEIKDRIKIIFRFYEIVKQSVESACEYTTQLQLNLFIIMIGQQCTSALNHLKEFSHASASVISYNTQHY